MKRPSRFFFLILTVAVCLVVFYRFVISSNTPPTGADAAQSSNLWHYVVSRFTFDGKAVMEPDKPPVFCKPGHNSATLDVYGVTNPDRMDEVMSGVQEWQATNRNMRLTVDFYERENWKQSTNNQGSSVAQRLPEVLLREYGLGPP
jgi:hypothetical protein